MKKSLKNILGAAALLMLTATSAFADEVKATKTVTANSDGSYTLTLETYADGEGIATTTQVNQPLDIVLVLDMSGSMDYDFTNENVYTALDSKTYSYTSLRDKSYFYLYEDGEYYKVNRAFDKGSTSNPQQCYLYITVDGVNYYLSGTSLSANKTTFSKYNTDIWTGVLYELKNVTKTRLEALKESVSSFIDEVKSKSTSNATHQIAIVTFAGSRDSKDVSNGLSSKFDDLKDIVANLDADGGTYPGEAMDKANTILNSVSNERKSSKLVVMFTDGVPAGGRYDPSDKFSSDNKKEANNTISKSNTLKNNKISYKANEDGTYTAVGITVYSVGIFTDPFTDIVNYMDYVSSNYPSATSMDNSGTAAVQQIYSFTASSAEALNEIFTSIANTATEGASSTSYTTENSDVRDFITPQFKLASGTGVSAIKVQYVPCEPETTSTTPVWLTPVDGSTKGITANPGAKGDDGITPVIIKGYDFKKNWVGPYMENGQVKKWHAGGKLVITINIELDPTYEAAGVVNTNTEDSGIYYKEEMDQPFTSTGINFPVPQTVSKDVAYLHIIKTGLGTGESTIFDIKVGSTVLNTVMVNAVKNEAYVKVDWLTEAAKADSRVFDSEHPLTEDDMIKFTVVERADWAWNAPDSASITSALYDFNAAGSAIPYTFEFGVGDPKTTVAHDEESAVIKK